MYDEVIYNGKNGCHTFQIVEMEPKSLTRRHYNVYEHPKGYVAWGQTFDDALELAKREVDVWQQRVSDAGVTNARHPHMPTVQNPENDQRRSHGDDSFIDRLRLQAKSLG